MLDGQVDPIPDYSAQDVTIMTSTFDIGLAIKTLRFKEGTQETINLNEYNTDCIVRFPYALAKIIAIQLRRSILQYERNANMKVAIPPIVSEALSINLEEDWY